MGISTYVSEAEYIGNRVNDLGGKIFSFYWNISRNQDSNKRGDLLHTLNERLVEFELFVFKNKSYLPHLDEMISIYFENLEIEENGRNRQQSQS